MMVNYTKVGLGGKLSRTIVVTVRNDFADSRESWDARVLFEPIQRMLAFCLSCQTRIPPDV